MLFQTYKWNYIRKSINSVLKGKVNEDKLLGPYFLSESELKKGNIEYVNEMLGHPYTIMGEVVHGKKLGRTLGMPTINQLAAEHKLLPPNGVYASVVRFDGNKYYGITNIGTKPTVSGDEIKGIETYLFDYTGDLYGKNVDVELYVFQRDELKFQTLDELVKYMQEDISFAKEFFQNKLIQ